MFNHSDQEEEGYNIQVTGKIQAGESQAQAPVWEVWDPAALYILNPHQKKQQRIWIRQSLSKK